jgi:hypothetical protein
MLLEVLYINSCVPKMPFCTLSPAANHANAPFKEHCEVLMWAVFILMPLSLYEGFQLRKELFDGIKIWRVGWQINQDDSRFTTQLRDPITVMG